MIIINLLPHREASRKRRQDAFYATLGLAALVGVLISVFIYLWYSAKIETQNQTNTYLSVEISRLEAQIKDITTLQAEIASLRARKTAVEDLQGDRNLPVELLTELVKQLPDGVFINSMKQDNQNILITGVAQSNERVSELLRNIGGNSASLTKPDLVEITATTVSLTPRDQRRVSNFSMRIGLVRAVSAKNVGAKAVSAAGSTPAIAVASASAAAAMLPAAKK